MYQICRSLFYSIIYTFIHYIYLSVFDIYLSIYLSMSVCSLSISPSIYQIIDLSIFRIYLSVSQSVYVSIFNISWSICLSLCIPYLSISTSSTSIYLFIHLYIHPCQYLSPSLVHFALLLSNQPDEKQACLSR